MIYAEVERILVPEDNGNQNPNELACALLVAVVVKQYVLMINAVSLLNHTYFTILLAV